MRYTRTRIAFDLGPPLYIGELSRLVVPVQDNVRASAAKEQCQKIIQLKFVLNPILFGLQQPLMSNTFYKL
jgi:hypothetical protein